MNIKRLTLLAGLLIGLAVQLHELFQADLQAQTRQETRFGDAFYNLNREAVRAALKSGADPNERYDGTGLSAISRVASAVMSAEFREPPMLLDEAEQKAIAILDLLFEAGAKIQPYDLDILHGPVITGAKKVTKYLLDRGANTNGSDYSGNTPVILATKYGHPELIKLLIEYGARPLDALTTVQIRFISAAGQGDLIAMKRELNNGARVNTASPTKQTALVEAIEGQHYRAVVELLRLGANPNLVGRMSVSPLHRAVLQPNPYFEKRDASELVKVLLKAGAHVSSTDYSKSKTPLHLAAQMNNSITVRMLLEAGAKVMPKDDDAKTPLDYAESADIIKLLKSYGAKEDQSGISSKSPELGRRDERPKTPEVPIRERPSTNHITSLPKWTPLPSSAQLQAQNSPKPRAELFNLISRSVWVVVAARSASDLQRSGDAAQGSAVAVTETQLLTNCHIVESRPLLWIKKADKLMRAKIIRGDSQTDRCMIGVDQGILIPVQGIRNYDDLLVGEDVFTIGSPSGLESTLGQGLISGLRRVEKQRLIQTTAQISPGSSGGGLFDQSGNLVGITTFMISDGQNLNFAIAVEDFFR